jgi:hypothetical protein
MIRISGSHRERFLQMTSLLRIKKTGLETGQKVWLVLGPSGIGKRSFGEWLATERNWLHLEIDRYPEGNAST